jgi:hypothetical protein
LLSVIVATAIGEPELRGDHTMSLEPASREEIAILARRAGLQLTATHFDQLCSAYEHLERMLGRIRRARSYADEPAHVFTPTKFIPTE